LETGVVTLIDKNGTSYEKKFKNILNYVGDTKERIFEGKGRIYFKNGPIYQGSFKNDEIDGSILGQLLIEN